MGHSSITVGNEPPPHPRVKARYRGNIEATIKSMATDVENLTNNEPHSSTLCWGFDFLSWVNT